VIDSNVAPAGEAGCSPGARSYYAGLRLRKPAQVARIAPGRKLLTVVCALLHHGVCFDQEWFARG
jgi:hypothetical protein